MRSLPFVNPALLRLFDLLYHYYFGLYISINTAATNNLLLYPFSIIQTLSQNKPSELFDLLTPEQQQPQYREQNKIYHSRYYRYIGL